MDENDLPQLTPIVAAIHKELTRLHCTRNEAAVFIWFADMPEYFETDRYAWPTSPVKTSEITRIYGVPVAVPAPTANIAKGVWIEDQSGNLYRVY